MFAKYSIIAGALAFAWAAIGAAHAAGNPQRGAMVYRACAACHSLEPGMHLTGPSLADLWGKKAASVKDFLRYSKALSSRRSVMCDGIRSALLSGGTIVASSTCLCRSVIGCHPKVSPGGVAVHLRGVVGFACVVPHRQRLAPPNALFVRLKKVGAPRSVGRAPQASSSEA